MRSQKKTQKKQIENDSQQLFFPKHPISDEILLAILSYLNNKELAKLSRTSKEWHRLIADNSLWKIPGSSINSKNDFLIFFSQLPPSLQKHLISHPEKIKKLNCYVNQDERRKFKAEIKSILSSYETHKDKKKKSERLEKSFTLFIFDVLSLEQIKNDFYFCIDTGYILFLEELIPPHFLETLRLSAINDYVFREKLKTLYHTNIITALREKLITLDQIIKHNASFIQAMLSDNGLAALRKKIISYEQIANYQGKELMELFSSSVISRLENKTLAISDINDLIPALKKGKNLNYNNVSETQIKALSLKLFKPEHVTLLPFYIQAFGEILIQEYEQYKIAEEKPNHSTLTLFAKPLPSIEDIFPDNYQDLPALTKKLIAQHDYLRTAMQAHIELHSFLPFGPSIDFDIKQNSKQLVTLKLKHRLPAQLFALLPQGEGIRFVEQHLRHAILLTKSCPDIGKIISANRDVDNLSWLAVMVHIDKLILALSEVDIPIKNFFNHTQAIKQFACRYPYTAYSCTYSEENQTEWLKNFKNELNVLEQCKPK